jgi:hypothetical protein
MSILTSVTAKVVHIRRDKYDIYIGRPGPWGNPFVIGRHGDRDRCIDNYELELRQRLAQSSDLRMALLQLDGKRLGCYCHPRRCHGDVLIKLIGEIKSCVMKASQAFRG